MIFNLSIRARMVLPMMLGMIVLASGLTYYFINSIEKNSDKDLHAIAERTVGILSHALEYSVSINNVKDSEYLVQWLLKQPDIHSIKITNNDNVMLNQICDQEVEKEFLHTFSKEIKLRTFDDSLSSENDIILDESNSNVETKVIGRVEVVVSSKRIKNEYSEWLSGALFFALTLLISATSFSLLSSNSISNSIRKIIKGINEMGKGDLSSRIQISEKKEIGEIAERFNNMADKVQDTEIALIQAHDLQKRFLATMSHDLRTPLGIMINMIDLTIKGGKIDSHSKLHLISGSASGKQLHQLIEDVLDIGKLEAKEETLNLESLDIIDEISKLIEVQKTSINENTYLANQLIEQQKDILIKADKQKILRIVSNLLSNAVKFTQAGSISIKCGLTDLDEDSKYLLFEIKDTGIGIPEDSLALIYQPFKQVGADTSTQYGGSGLGLSIVSEYLLLMNGEITVESKYGLGTVFSIKIPLLFSAKEEVIPVHIEKQLNNVVSYNKKTISILIIDDNEDYIEIFRSYLAHNKYNLTLCNTGVEGINLFKSNTYDIVLLDCQMPVLSGFEVSKELRLFEKESNQSKTPILAVTANSKLDINEKCMSVGMTDVLTKPFYGEDLIAKINELCE
jgi:signal transduction histidine kinase/ActR/RegA family two-component response regulator